MNPLVSQILARAFADLGEHEVPGTESNPKILGWMRSWFPRQRDDTTLAWCAIWISVVMKDCGLAVPEFPFRAKSWAGWGTERTTEPQLGDVCVLDRAGGGHVGIVLRVTKSHVWLLSGNHGNAIDVAKFWRSRIVKHGVRYVA
jgi:uncharacterized protein (TIGR02594 family)